MAKKTRSPVWEVFKEVDKNEVICTLCKDIVKTKGNTTNMVSHLRHSHPTVHEQILPHIAKKPPRKKSRVQNGQSLLLEADLNENSNCSTDSQQVPIGNFFY